MYNIKIMLLTRKTKSVKIKYYKILSLRHRTLLKSAGKAYISKQSPAWQKLAKFQHAQTTSLCDSSKSLYLPLYVCVPSCVNDCLDTCYRELCCNV